MVRLIASFALLTIAASSQEELPRQVVLLEQNRIVRGSYDAAVALASLNDAKRRKAEAEREVVIATSDVNVFDAQYKSAQQSLVKMLDDLYQSCGADKNEWELDKQFNWKKKEAKK